MKNMLFTLSILFSLSACDLQDIESEIPNRPAQVSADAVWIAGLDGGVFVLVEKNENLKTNEYFGEIYYVSGDLAYKGKLEIFPEDSSIIDYSNPKIYQGWDGDTLYIEGNKQLKIKK